MPSETDGSAPERALGSSVRSLCSANNLAMLLAGTLAGYSLTVLGTDAVVVPLVGPSSGTLVGAAGLAVALAAYRWGSRCEDCGAEGCGCAGECGDRCSYDP